MNNLENKLINQSTKEEFLALLKEKIYQDEMKENLLLVREIDQDLGQLSPSARAIFNAEVSELYYLAKWRALPALLDNQVLDLVANHLLLIKKLSDSDEPILDLTQAIRGFMVTVITYEDRDRLKIAFRDSLLGNKEIISPSLKLKTIGDWVKDISSKVDPYLVDVLKKNEYYVRDQNFRSLSKVDQELLKSIVGLYNYCFYSSATPDSLDETLTIVDDEDGKIKILNFGVLEDTGLTARVDKEEEDEESDDLEKESVSSEQASQQKTSEEASDLTNLYQQTLNSIISKYKIAENLALWENKTPLELINALETSSRAEIILPALVTLVKNNKDLAILTTNTALQRSLAIANGDLTGLLKALFTRAGLNDQEGIVMAIRLSQDNKSLSGLAYGDLKSGAFHWR